MTRWFIATKERRAQVLDIAGDGTPSAVYNSQLVPGGSAQFWSCWSPDGGTTIFLGGREWGTDSACLWKSINGGLAWTDAAGDAGSPGELPSPYHGDNCRVRAMYGIADNVFFAHCEGVGAGNDQVFKYDNGVWSIQRDSAGPGQAPSQMHISPAGFFLGTKYLGWQAASLEWYGWDNFFTGAAGKQPIGVWYRPDVDEWYILNMNSGTPECWKGTPFVPTEDYPGAGGSGAGTWALDHTFTAKGRALDDGSNALWGDDDGNLYTILDGGANSEVWKRDKDTGVWSLDYTVTGAGNLPGGIWGAGDEILAGCSSVSAEIVAFRTAAGVWSTIDLTSLFGLGVSDNPQGIWASYEDADPPVLQNQSPAPSSAGNRGDVTQYLEVVDLGSGVDTSSVEIFFNGELAWGGGGPAGGWSGTRGTVADGYSYTLNRDTPLPAGATITRRVVAADLAATPNILDQSETFDTGSFLDSVDVATVATVGGAKMVVTGLFTLDPMKIYLGPLGTVADPECYGGSGLGYSPMSRDGQTVAFWTPPLEKQDVGITIVDGGETVTLAVGTVTVVERNWPGRGFTSRKDHQPWSAVGARRLKLEDQE